MLFDASVFFDAPLVTVGVLAVLTATAANRLKLSSWWILVPGAIATTIAVFLYAPVSSCNAASSIELWFGGAILVAIGFYVGTALAALLDAIRLVRSGAKRSAALSLLPFLTGAALAVGTFFVLVLALVGCLS